MPQVREDKREALLGLIRNLLALSQSPNEHEAALAASKASELLMKYNLDRAEVEGWKAPELTDFTEKQAPFNNNNKVEIPGWKITLMSALARHNLCRFLWWRGWKTYKGEIKAPRYQLIGRETSILVTEYQFEYMVKALQHALEMAWIAYLNSGIDPFLRDEKRAFSHSFFIGAADVLWRRLQEVRYTEKQIENTMALITTEETALQAFYETLYPPYKPTQEELDRLADLPPVKFKKRYYKAKVLSSDSGYAAGREAGAGLSIHTGLGDQQEGAMLPSAM